VGIYKNGNKLWIESFLTSKNKKLVILFSGVQHTSYRNTNREFNLAAVAPGII
jgi:hypothetical protein